jgi:titin
VKLTWETPSSDGGSPITDYQVSSDNGATWTAVGSTTAMSYTFTGLTNGNTSYQFTVRAVNANGNGTQATPPSASPSTTASAPSITATTAGDGQVQMTWTAPTSDGGNGITDYEVSSDGGQTWTSVGGATTTSYTFEGLENGTDYTLQVRAVNGNGEGAAASTTASPSTTPGAPVLGDNPVVSGNGSLNLSWSAPNSDGGSPITGYQVSSDGGSTWTNLGGTSYGASGLNNGQSYTYQVRAVNAKGAGPAVSITGVPSTTSSAPQNLTAVPDNGLATLTWEAPASDGGHAITAYEVSTDGGKTFKNVGNVLT